MQQICGPAWWLRADKFLAAAIGEHRPLVALDLYTEAVDALLHCAEEARCMSRGDGGFLVLGWSVYSLAIGGLPDSDCATLVLHGPLTPALLERGICKVGRYIKGRCMMKGVSSQTAWKFVEVASATDSEVLSIDFLTEAIVALLCERDEATDEAEREAYVAVAASVYEQALVYVGRVSGLPARVPLWISDEPTADELEQGVARVRQYLARLGA